MVIVQYTTKAQSKPTKEMFLNPQHYTKWRNAMGNKIVTIKPIKGGR
ncbi:hypothetical protein Goe16_02240 [Bacillus phage vB_BsuM-Goe16]|nr:hypothetical protein Goe16_00300 [Bacillus phage vB_BsuM-Goe16]WCS68638.1 hypothetical protein Goe16_02240 [Bacillus phage vB_BsuM-Goe16]